MSNDGNLDAEIARRESTAVQRRKSPKPDVETFGKMNRISQEDTNDTAIEMDDFSGLEVDFS